jgi:ATP-dependent Lhr-like helicase
MFFYSRERARDPHPPLGRQIPWDMLQTIAIIQLYLEEKWIEPPAHKRFPLSLLYHQTMSTLAALNELKAPDLAERILTLAPFKEVTPDQFRTVLQHLLENRHLEKTEINSLILGLEGTKIVGSYWFYATFQAEEMYQVREASREIGFIQTSAEPGDYIRLAGYIWRVLEVNPDKRIIFVERTHGRAETTWTGSGRSVHSRIINRVRSVLTEDIVYPYLQERARIRLSETRELARQTGLTEQPILPLGGNQYMILPWCDSRTFETLELMLDSIVPLGDSVSPYYLEIKINDEHSENPALVRERLHNFLAKKPSAESFVERLPRYALYRDKFDRYIPEPLLRHAFTHDQLDMGSAIHTLENLL